MWDTLQSTVIKRMMCAHTRKEEHRKAECLSKERARTCKPCTKAAKRYAKEKGQTGKMMVDRLIEKTDYRGNINWINENVRKQTYD